MADAHRRLEGVRNGVRALARGLVIGAIYVYQGISSLTPGSCRFEPSCSHYGLAAVRAHGPLVGGWLALKRIVRCRPGGDWGYDPVPERCSGRAHHTNAGRKHGRPSRAA